MVSGSDREQVVAAAAVQRVVVGEGREGIADIGRRSPEPVGGAVSGQPIAERRAGQLLDLAEAVAALGPRILDLALEQQRDGDASERGIRLVIAGPVDSRTARNRVVPEVAREVIVACLTKEAVVVPVSAEAITAATAI